jgi:hypothetical protein
MVNIYNSYMNSKQPQNFYVPIETYRKQDTEVTNEKGDFLGYLTEMIFEPNKNGPMTVNDVKNYSNKISKQLHDIGVPDTYSIQMNIYFDKPVGGYYRLVGQMGSVGENVALPPIDNYSNNDDINFENIPKFIIFIVPGQPKAGGCNGYKNDCLFKAIKQIVGNPPWVSDTKMKEYLGLLSHETVDISLIPKIEKMLPKHKISIVGDYIETSKQKGKQEIVIKLQDGHYEIYKDNYQRVKGVTTIERKPVMVNQD